MKRAVLTTHPIPKNFNETKLTLYIEKLKSDAPSIFYAKIQLLNKNKTVIATHTLSNQPVGKTYNPYKRTFNITTDQLQKTFYYQIQFIMDMTNEYYPVMFNHILFGQGDINSYHPPNSNIETSEIRFANNFYCNLYNDDGNYLQVIRPYYNNFNTSTLKKSKVTVLAPHLSIEDDVDKPEAIGLEFMNQSDQVIEILR